MDGIRTHRVRKGLTQAELAKLIGCDQATISDYEVGKSVPLGPRLQEIARALGVSADDIDLTAPSPAGVH